MSGEFGFEIYDVDGMLRPFESETPRHGLTEDQVKALMLELPRAATEAFGSFGAALMAAEICHIALSLIYGEGACQRANDRLSEDADGNVVYTG